MTNHRGAYYTYDNSPAEIKKFYGATDYKTEIATVLSGQVLKAGTLVESDANGKVIAHSGLSEKALITFPTKVDTGETVIIAGLTFTAGSNATTTQAQLRAAWKNLPAGTTAAQANALNASAVSAAIGTFTAGTLTNYRTVPSSTAGSLWFISTLPGTNPTDLTVTGTGDASTVAITAANIPHKVVKGVLVYDVDASGGDTSAAIYTDATFWHDWIVWSNDTDVDTITLDDGTTKAVTTYNSCAITDLLKKKILEGSEIHVGGFTTAGEVI